MTATPIGEILDGLGVRATQNEGDLVSDALVILKVVEPDGGVRLSLAWSEGMSWIERLGMVTAAQALEVPDSGAAVGDGA